MSAFLETQPQAFKGKVLQWSLRRKHKIWTKGKLGQSKHKPRALWLDGMGVLHVVSSAANLVSCTSSMTALLPPRWACWARKHLNLAGWLNQAWTTAPSAQRLEFVKSSSVYISPDWEVSCFPSFYVVFFDLLSLSARPANNRQTCAWRSHDATESFITQAAFLLRNSLRYLEVAFCSSEDAVIAFQKSFLSQHPHPTSLVCCVFSTVRGWLPPCWRVIDIVCLFGEAPDISKSHSSH